MLMFIAILIYFWKPILILLVGNGLFLMSLIT